MLYCHFKRTQKNFLKVLFTRKMQHIAGRCIHYISCPVYILSSTSVDFLHFTGLHPGSQEHFIKNQKKGPFGKHACRKLPRNPGCSTKAAQFAE